MRAFRFRNIPAVLTVLLVASAVPAGEPPRVFTGTAVVNAPHGTRRMGLTLVANRLTTLAQAQYLKEVLANGGQGALLAALRGRNDGQLRLGGLVDNVALVIVEPADDGDAYFFLTLRTIRIDESTFGSDSVDSPFGIAKIEVDGFGDARGELHVAAALHVDPDGQVFIETTTASTVTSRTSASPTAARSRSGHVLHPWKTVTSIPTWPPTGMS